MKTVGELIEELKEFPCDSEVIVLGQGINEGCECEPTASFSRDRHTNQRSVLIHEVTEGVT